MDFKSHTKLTQRENIPPLAAATPRWSKRRRYSQLTATPYSHFGQEATVLHPIKLYRDPVYFILFYFGSQNAVSLTGIYCLDIQRIPDSKGGLISMKSVRIPKEIFGGVGWGANNLAP